MTSSIWLRSERSDSPWLIHHTLSAVDAGPARKCVLGFAVFVTLLTATSRRQDWRTYLPGFVNFNWFNHHLAVGVSEASTWLWNGSQHYLVAGSLRGLAFKMSLVRSIPICAVYRIHNDTVSALGRAYDQFSDQGIVLLPVLSY